MGGDATDPVLQDKWGYSYVRDTVCITDCKNIKQNGLGKKHKTKPAPTKTPTTITHATSKTQDLMLSRTGPGVRYSRSSTHTGTDVMAFNKLFHLFLCMQNTDNITSVFHGAFCEALLFVQVIWGVWLVVLQSSKR